MYIERREDYKEKVFFENLKEMQYKEFVAGYYKLDGYSIYLNKKDEYKYIDIICMKDDELILIQTLNSEEASKINNESLKIFLNSCNEYINKNNLFDKKIKLKYVASNDILDDLSCRILKENKTLHYKILNNINSYNLNLK